MPLSKDLYALINFWGKVEVMHWRINDYSSFSDPKTLISGIICENKGRQRYQSTIENVESMLKEKHPKALVIREPLKYCSCGEESKPHSCLAHLFEKAYAKKIGFEGELMTEMDIPQGYSN
jgi:hypothetical protein